MSTPPTVPLHRSPHVRRSKPLPATPPREPRSRPVTHYGGPLPPSPMSPEGRRLTIDTNTKSAFRQSINHNAPVPVHRDSGVCTSPIDALDIIDEYGDDECLRGSDGLSYLSTPVIDQGSLHKRAVSDSSSLQSGPPPPVPPKSIMHEREAITREILTSEESYYIELRGIHIDIVKPMQENAHKTGLLRDVERGFACLEQMIRFHAQLLTALRTPFQRLTRYPLLLSRLLLVTPPHLSNDAWRTVREAYSAAKAACEDVQNAKAQEEEYQNLRQVERKLAPCDFVLAVRKRRRIIFDAGVKLKFEKKGLTLFGKEVSKGWCVLCNDGIVIWGTQFTSSEKGTGQQWKALGGVERVVNARRAEKDGWLEVASQDVKTGEIGVRWVKKEGTDRGWMDVWLQGGSS
ncbi:hypothetical protein YB2330_005333 [Saitoella coloradoensis]